MPRKPLVSMVSNLVKDEFKSSGMTVNGFANMVRLNRQTIKRLLNESQSYLRSDIIDQILNKFEVSYTELEKRYGEYEKE
ncbi:hypothetical protein [Erysipelothrix aquatica]|uniref:hypothetical protein n=1 Tax=Erysipelothrix aquatica TaxID=2683714 RepID=UPI0013577233|nr:hypothetical protein [Erysipelothrix aquatica]